MSDVDLQAIGLSVRENFITPEEEDELLKIIRSPGVTPKQTKGRNSIKRYGSDLPYKSSIVSPSVPAHFDFLLDRLVAENMLDVRPDSVTVNEYLVGQEITPHIDSPSSGRVITVLSLLGEATMAFQLDRQRASVVVAPRAVVQMRGEIRDVWKHSIEPVKNVRYSLVFRCSEKRPDNPKVNTDRPVNTVIKTKGVKHVRRSKGPNRLHR